MTSNVWPDIGLEYPYIYVRASGKYTHENRAVYRISPAIPVVLDRNLEAFNAQKRWRHLPRLPWPALSRAVYSACQVVSQLIAYHSE